ncbi:MAG TPA: CAP domain-containing protein [Chloroflexia bacterium]|nr:CAP domain-containing protein [Chloroflexia bacterium]
MSHSSRALVRFSSWLLLLTVAVMAIFGGHATASASVLAPSQAPTSQGLRFYQATGFSVGGAFLQFFDKYGGVRIFGYPISNEVAEGGMTVQYFERQRFEYHKEAAGTPYEVQLGALGVEASRGKVSLAPIAPVPTTNELLYFRETGHSLSGAFLGFWRANGSIRVLGFPISEPVTINGFLTQYFERARMEYHPEKAAAGYAVELGHLGKEYLASHPGLGSGGAGGPVPGASLSPVSKALVAHINGARQAAGLKPVAIDDRLSALAQQRSDDMVARGYFSHVTPEGKGFVDFLKASGIRFKFSGEILAKNNFREELAALKAYEWFMGSTTHHAIIVDPRFNLAGVGMTKDSKGYYVFTVIFIQAP